MWFLLIPFLIAIILFMMYNNNHISMPVLLLLLIVLLIFTFQILRIHMFLDHLILMSNLETILVGLLVVKIFIRNKR